MIIHTGNEERAQYIQPPVVPGHEFAGEVVKLGKGYKQVVVNLHNECIKINFVNGPENRIIFLESPYSVYAVHTLCACTMSQDPRRSMGLRLVITLSLKTLFRVGTVTIASLANIICVSY